MHLTYEVVTLYDGAFQRLQLMHWMNTAPHLLCVAASDSVCPLWLSLALLTKSLVISSPAGTKIFQFPEYACVLLRTFGNPRFRARLAATLGLSQLATSFIAAAA